MSVNKNDISHVFGTPFNRKSVQYSYKKSVWKENKMKLKGGVLQFYNAQISHYLDIQIKITEYLSKSYKVWLFKFRMTYKENSIK